MKKSRIATDIKKSMLAEDALKATYPKVVKGARSYVKGKISSAVDFDHSKISRTNVLAAGDKLVTNLQLF